MPVCTQYMTRQSVKVIIIPDMHGPVEYNLAYRGRVEAAVTESVPRAGPVTEPVIKSPFALPRFVCCVKYSQSKNLFLQSAMIQTGGKISVKIVWPATMKYVPGKPVSSRIAVKVAKLCANAVPIEAPRMRMVAAI
jgi:hypothetical protein